MEEVEKIEDIIQGFTEFPAMSPQVNELFGALAKAQGEMRLAGKSSNNPFFKSKYADLASIVEASRPVLSKYGLGVTQLVEVEDGSKYLITLLCHSSGQFIRSKAPITPLKEDIQSFGSAITYLRRYTYASIVGVVADEEDDDAESAMGRRAHVHATVKTYSDYERISSDNLRILTRELENAPGLEKNLLEHYRIRSLEDIPQSKFEAIFDRVRKIKHDEKA